MVYYFIVGVPDGDVPYVIHDPVQLEPGREPERVSVDAGSKACFQDSFAVDQSRVGFLGICEAAGPALVLAYRQVLGFDALGIHHYGVGQVIRSNSIFFQEGEGEFGFLPGFFVGFSLGEKVGANADSVGQCSLDICLGAGVLHQDAGISIAPVPYPDNREIDPVRCGLFPVDLSLELRYVHSEAARIGAVCVGEPVPLFFQEGPVVRSLRERGVERDFHIAEIYVVDSDGGGRGSLRGFRHIRGSRICHICGFCLMSFRLIRGSFLRGLDHSRRI